MNKSIKMMRFGNPDLDTLPLLWLFSAHGTCLIHPDALHLLVVCAFLIRRLPLRMVLHENPKELGLPHQSQPSLGVVIEAVYWRSLPKNFCRKYEAYDTHTKHRFSTLLLDFRVYNSGKSDEL